MQPLFIVYPVTLFCNHQMGQNDRLLPGKCAVKGGHRVRRTGSRYREEIALAGPPQPAAERFSVTNGKNRRRAVLKKPSLILCKPQK